MEKRGVASIRTDYTRDELLESIVASDPIVQFQQWFNDALANEVMEPNAMALATVSSDGKPASRIVLLKGFDGQGFTFFTNYDSRKGKHLMQQKDAALLFFWPELQRQVRIEGPVYKIDASQSDEYFASRPKGSQLGAWASPQSSAIPGRETLEDNINALEATYLEQEIVPRPPHWGGFLLSPSMIEFWQGRASRLHDRIVYTKDSASENRWFIERLAP